MKWLQKVAVSLLPEKRLHMRAISVASPLPLVRPILSLATALDEMSSLGVRIA